MIKVYTFVGLFLLMLSVGLAAALRSPYPVFVMLGGSLLTIIILVWRNRRTLYNMEAGLFDEECLLCGTPEMEQAEDGLSSRCQACGYNSDRGNQLDVAHVVGWLTILEDASEAFSNSQVKPHLDLLVQSIDRAAGEMFGPSLGIQDELEDERTSAVLSAFDRLRALSKPLLKESALVRADRVHLIDLERALNLDSFEFNRAQLPGIGATLSEDPSEISPLSFLNETEINVLKVITEQTVSRLKLVVAERVGISKLS